MATKSDLRSTSRTATRLANNKAKWAHGVATHPAGRAPSHPRPLRPADLDPHRSSKCRVSGSGNKAAAVRRADMLSAADNDELAWLSSSPGNSTASEPEDEEQEAVRLVQEYEALQEVYGAEGTMPGSGSQVLHGALDKAVVVFEDRATEKLVRDEWAVVGESGEEVEAKVRRARKNDEEWVGGEEFEMV